MRKRKQIYQAHKRSSVRLAAIFIRNYGSRKAVWWHKVLKEKKKKLARDNSIYRKFVLQKNEGEFKIFPGKQINPKGVY